jgi:hypothetical protein
MLLVQWLLGGLTLRRFARLRREDWTVAANAFARGSVIVALLAVGAVVLLLRSDAAGPVIAQRLPWLIPLALLGTPAATGSWLVLHAGALERRGALPQARAVVWLGGRLMASGALALLTVHVVRLAISGPADEGLVTSLVAASGLAGAGFAGLLAGLSGKPRPTGPLAVLLYVAALAMLIAAA